MRIGIYDPYLDTMGGGEKYILTLASCLSQHHDVDLLWDNKDITEKANQRFALDLHKLNFAENIFDTSVSLFDRIRKARKYDYLIVLSDGSIPFIPTTKMILHFQFPLEWVTPSFIEKAKLAQIDHIICNSYFTKSYIDKKFSINTDVIYPPVELRLDPRIAKENTILHVGRFGITSDGFNYKKQDVLIRTFKVMVDNGLKKWKFVLVMGVREEDKEKVKKLQQLAKGYPIEFVINAPNKVLWEYYAKAKIYWHASGYGEDLEKHPEYAEHFGISTVEAMGAGAVPIVINAGGQKEIVQEGKNGLLWNTLDELEEKTLSVINHAKTWKLLSDSARKRAEDFSQDIFCNQVYGLIR